jgi:signal transduction histidine kinase
MLTRFRPTVRLRLTLLYGGLFLIAGALLLTFNYFLVRRSITLDSTERHARVEQFLEEAGLHEARLADPDHLVGGRPFRDVFEEAQRQFVDDTTRKLVAQSLIALSGMAVAAMALGWFVAGRVLRPLKDITATARRLSEQNLHERIAMKGPQDELRELADTLDDMLRRLEAAFESQRNFVSNASHELLTPLSIVRAELDVTLADPDAGTDDLRAMAETVRIATERSERLIQRLLALAQSEQGLGAKTEVEIDDLVRDATIQLRPLAHKVDVRVVSHLEESVVDGDRVLLERLVGNLIENAIVHNRPGGEARIRTGAENARAILQVDNDGSETISEETVARLFEPFARVGNDRLQHRKGFGLGLSIVRSVAQAHGASVDAAPRPDGGLSITVAFPKGAAGSSSKAGDFTKNQHHIP